MGYEGIIRISACVSLILGAIACFAGFKIMKFAMALSNFIIGVSVGTAVGIFGKSAVIGIILIAVLGIGFAILSYGIRLTGIFILTSFLAGAAGYVFSQNVIAAIIIGMIAGVLSVFFEKPAVILSTSFGGAGIILGSAYTMMGLSINPHPALTAILMFFITISGALCQFVTTKTRTRHISNIRKTGADDLTFSERRYPGMQRAYRNFCIECGYELLGKHKTCPRCGFSFEN